MTTSLLTLSLLVEPDRMRLSRFVLQAVDTFKGDQFVATAALVPMLESLRHAMFRSDGGVEVTLTIDKLHLSLGWEGERSEVVKLTHEPLSDELHSLIDYLRMASESADPELLMRRNQKISDELESYMQVAADQMKEMEAVLEKKKEELQASIKQAETDALTGLLNRGAYDDRLREAFLRGQRQGEVVSLLLLDLDFFKQINDTHGHQYGDEYLKRMADVMRASVREHVDIPCRMGGDEFAVVALCGTEIAERIATKILDGMQSKVSIGIAECLATDTIDTLVGRADEALYEAKRRGRGQFAVAAEQLSAAADG
ncbi:GGDEF domain-containing protein [Solemya pervernicosa gill symbiont]|uniref:diguanylate cyclase n=2 Tax=Gammaproteobacteria incertae sedis TaxID=118884 RepID=A0A1T2L010_9GAMM|nr:GGDEF domain-containing protein [Solemya pervernicosa gill symbiont]OOZ38411.1 GGDEF domain-containing protein [Solemya pervernicosa gill symbiont]